MQSTRVHRHLTSDIPSPMVPRTRTAPPGCSAFEPPSSSRSAARRDIAPEATMAAMTSASAWSVRTAIAAQVLAAAVRVVASGAPLLGDCRRVSWEARVGKRVRAATRASSGEVPGIDRTMASQAAATADGDKSGSRSIAIVSWVAGGRGAASPTRCRAADRPRRLLATRPDPPAL